MQRNFSDPPPIHNPYASSSSTTQPSYTETLLRKLYHDATATTRPSLLAVQKVHEQLLIQRRDVDWTLDLAQGLGRLVAEQLESLVITKDDGDGHNINSMDEVLPSELGTTILALLDTAMEDWQDHIMYAVLVQEHATSSNITKESISTNNNKGRRCKNLLDLLTRLSVLSTDGPEEGRREDLQRNARIGLATAWRCLDRLQECATLSHGRSSGGVSSSESHRLDTPWWVNDEDARRLWTLSLNNLLWVFSDQDEFTLRQPMMTRRDSCKLAELSIIASLLRHDLIDLSNGNSLEHGSHVTEVVVSKLIKCVHVLSHSVLPPSSSEHALPIAMMAMSVLSMMEASVNRTAENSSLSDMFHSLTHTIQSTRLVENIVQFTFLSTTCDSSRWILPASKPLQKGFLQNFGLYLITCWKCCGGTAWSVFVSLGQKMNQTVEKFWLDLLTQKYAVGDDVEAHLNGLLWLERYHRTNARYSLESAMKKTFVGGATDFTETECSTISKESCQKLLLTLFGWLWSKSAASYTLLMKIAKLLEWLLADRRSVTAHDELSRALWSAVDHSMVNCHLESVLDNASTEDSNQPLLLCLLDLLDTLLESGEYCNILIGTLGAHNVETLIYLVKPHDVRYDFTQGGMVDDGTSEADMNSDTPPLHNLSRVDEASICIEHEDAKEPRGWDCAVRLSAATVLARFAYASSSAAPDEGSALLISRISLVVNNFLEDSQRLNVDMSDDDWFHVQSSLDECRRICRLQHVVAVPENESFLATILFTSQTVQQYKFKSLVDEKAELQHNLALALKRERAAHDDKSRIFNQMKSQSIMFQREFSRLRLNMGQDARQIVAIHASERANAERRAKRSADEAEQANSQVEAAKEQAQEMKNFAALSKDELRLSIAKVDELQVANEDLQRQIHTETSRVGKLLEEVQASREAILSYSSKCCDMQKDLEERGVIIAKYDGTNGKLHENLEDLFADMVSLAQIYQHSENEQASDKKRNAATIEEMSGKLFSERQRNDELAKRVHDYQEENDKLYRKLAKYKERLELERKDRMVEDERRKKRNGPVGYFNSLHESTASDKSNSRRQTESSRDQTKSQRKSRDEPCEKENGNASNYYSTASQRRKHY